jgi:serine/alanine adding enzyme
MESSASADGRTNPDCMTGYSNLDGLVEISRERWTEFIHTHPHASFFQTPELYDYLELIPNYRPVVTGVADPAGVLVGVMLGFIISEHGAGLGYLSARVIIHGGPLVPDNHPDAAGILDFLLKGFIEKVKRISLIIQIRNHHDQSGFRAVFEKNGFIYKDHLNLTLNTLPESGNELPISKSKLRQVKKSLAAGAVITTAETLDEIREFYRILKELYRTKIRKPLPAFSFFEVFFRSMVQGKLGIILLVKFQGKVVGGMVCPILPGKIIYEWYVCGLDHEYREIYPSVLATWGAMNYATTHGIPEFDFMGMGQPKEEYGVRRFKSSFGGKTVNFGRFVRTNNRLIFTIAEFGYKILTSIKKR